LKIFWQTLIFFFQPYLDFQIFMTIRIVIEKRIRINQTLIQNLQPQSRLMKSSKEAPTSKVSIFFGF